MVGIDFDLVYESVKMGDGMLVKHENGDFFVFFVNLLLSRKHQAQYTHWPSVNTSTRSIKVMGGPRLAQANFYWFCTNKDMLEDNIT